MKDESSGNSAGPSRSFHFLFFLFFHSKTAHVPVAKVSFEKKKVPQPGTGPSSLPSHLQLADPGAVPVGEACPLHKELPLWVALEGGVGQRVVWLAVRPWRHLGWQRRLAPRPVQDLLDFSFEGRALRGKYRWKCCECTVVRTVDKQLKSREEKKQEQHVCNGGALQCQHTAKRC